MKQGDTIYSIKDLLNRATVLTPPQKVYISDGQVEMVEIEIYPSNVKKMASYRRFVSYSQSCTRSKERRKRKEKISNEIQTERDLLLYCYNLAKQQPNRNLCIILEEIAMEKFGIDLAKKEKIKKKQ